MAFLLGPMLVATLIEVVGVGSIYPLLQILATPEGFAEGPLAAWLFTGGPRTWPAAWHETRPWLPRGIFAMP